MTRRPPSLRSRIPRKKARRRLPNWRLRVALSTVVVVVGVLAWAAIARGFAPASNTSLTRFDAIIVLGSPADGDGNPTPEQLARVTEGVNEYKRGTAPRLILTGGAARNHFVEARVMARTAEAQGIPASAIFVEPQAMDTIQNACYSVRIMREHGWQSGEVVSSAIHLRRAGLVFRRLPIEWRSHEAPLIQPESSAYQAGLSTVETMKTVRYLVWTSWSEHCEPE